MFDLLIPLLIASGHTESVYSTVGLINKLRNASFADQVDGKCLIEAVPRSLYINIYDGIIRIK